MPCIGQGFIFRLHFGMGAGKPDSIVFLSWRVLKGGVEDDP